MLWHIGVEAFQRALLTDISDEALKIAQQNWEKLFIEENNKAKDFKPTFLKADLLQHAELAEARKNASQNNEKLLLVGNLPYIPEELFEDNTDQSVKKREPKFAFVGGDDGLDRYRKMFDQLIVLQEENPVNCTQFLEMMTWQVDILRDEYGEYFVFEEVKTFHFNIRIVKTTRK